MAQKPSIPSGTRDFPPQVMMRRELIFDTIRNVFRKYGYAPIETPAMENLSVLTGKYGEEGDRLIFKILNNGDYLKKGFKTLKQNVDIDSVFEKIKDEANYKQSDFFEESQKMSATICDRALRYDLTVPFARFVVMHQNDLAFPFKRYQIQPVYRADRPQKGRYREFYQCDADVVGSDSLLYEAEFICIFDEVLSALKIPGFSIMVNNRKILNGYAEVIGQADQLTNICVAIDKLDKIGTDGVRKELGERGIGNQEADALFELIGFEGSNEEKLDFLEGKFAQTEIGLEGIAEMREVLNYLKYFEIQTATVDFNLELARGLDYYTGTIFEVKAHKVSIGSICGGGRYADLTGVFGGKDLSGVGISFGADRIYDVLEELDLFGDVGESPVKVLLVNFGEETKETALKTLWSLRKAGISAEYYPDFTKMKKQFAYAGKKELPFTLIIGAEEAKTGKFQLKNMKSGEQSFYDIEEIINLLSQK